MKKIFLMSLCCALLLVGGRSAMGDTQEPTDPKAIKVGNNTSEPDAGFYTWPIEKRIDDLEKRNNSLASLSDEEKELFKRQLEETNLLTIHDIFAQLLTTSGKLANSIVPKASLSKAPVEKLADFVYLFDVMLKDICDKDGAYKKNLIKLYQVSRCLAVKPRGRRSEKRSKICEENDCTSAKRCLATALGCTITALKPLVKMFTQGVDINGQNIDSGLAIITKVVRPIIAIEVGEPSQFIKDIKKFGILLKLTLTFFKQTRDMLLAAKDSPEIVVGRASKPSELPAAPGKMSPELERTQLVFNGIGSVANFAGAFTKGLGTGVVGNISNSLVYGLINIANMGTDIVTIINTNAFQKIIKRLECLYKDKQTLTKEAAAYVGKPGDNLSCPSLGCVDLKTCHAITTLALANVIRPFIENFFGKVQLDSSGNPTNKIEKGLFLNITIAFQEALSLLTTQNISEETEKKTGYKKKLKAFATNKLEKLQELTVKGRDIEIMLARFLPQLIQALEMTTLKINPDASKYVKIRTQLATEEIITEETIEEGFPSETAPTENIVETPVETTPTESTETSDKTTPTESVTEDLDFSKINSDEELKTELKELENEQLV